MMSDCGIVSEAIFQFEHQVSFSETDAAGVVHFSRFLCWVEDAEHRFLQNQGFQILPQEGGGWPRVSVSCDYHSPCYFGDLATISLVLHELGHSSLTLSFEIRVGERLTATGQQTSVRVGADGKARPFDESEKDRLR